MYFMLSEHVHVFLKIVAYVLYFKVMLQVITSIYKFFVPKKLKINTCDEYDCDCSPVPVTPDNHQFASAVSLPQNTTCTTWTQGWLVEVKVFSDVTPCDLSRKHSTDVSKNNAATCYCLEGNFMYKYDKY